MNLYLIRINIIMKIIHNLNIPSNPDEVVQYLKLHGVQYENPSSAPNKLAILLAAKLHGMDNIDVAAINPYENFNNTTLSAKTFKNTFEYMYSVMKTFNF